MDRLTNRNTAEVIKKNLEGLQKVGIAPSPMNLEYIRLAEYENAQEDADKLCEEMQAAINLEDPGESHMKGDDILRKALINFGCQKLINLYDKLQFWYE